ncbi:DUF5719 family protein [Streptomyces sp. ICBB 8177]|uniref:DUF5719 family protein n=1 Tax=Streptomyces sp. ICBB 8177 TaxID=563922 RepID=UPI000D68526D|nr:DUF5719 family protein [Streptomyces sp. ICBB 8177]PWI46096.1 hypothetical protein CK485_02980 [Streptomyces sp. ICBB 8177]
MNRTTYWPAGVVAAFAAVFAIATVLAPAPGSDQPKVSTTAARKPVQRSTLVCPGVTGSDYAATTYTAYTPPGTVSGSGGTAQLQVGQTADGAGNTTSGAGDGKPVAPLAAPGKPVTADAAKTASPLIGTADGAFAPGWTVQETTTVQAGAGHGLLGTSCGTPGADFWIPGASTASSRQDYVQLTNPDSTAAVADIELYDANGAVNAPGGEGITVPGDSSVPVLLSTLTGENSSDLTVHVEARTGRVGAAVQAMDSSAGGDWLDPSATPATSAVLPGIPADASDVRLVAYATGSDDANLKVQLLTPTGAITPAGHETLDLKSGMTTAVDLGALTKGQAGSLRLTPTDPSQAAPFVAALKVVRGRNGNDETAFIPATAAVGQRATVADNRSGGTTLSLAATDAAATVRITSSAGSGGGTPATKTVTIQPGTTVSLTPPAPQGGKGTFAVTVEPLSGGPVYASRELAVAQDSLPAFTIQTMPDDGGTVAVPTAGQDLTILQR